MTKIDRYSYLTPDEIARYSRASLEAAGYTDQNSSYETLTNEEHQARFEAYSDGIFPIRSVGIGYWFDIHKSALVKAMRACGIVPSGMSRLNKAMLARACLPVLHGEDVETRAALLIAIRKEADAYDMAKWGRPVGERMPVSNEFIGLI